MDSGERVRAPCRFEVGERIAGRYEVRSELGSGAFSVVYLVRDTVVDREMALKLFGPNFDLEAMRRESEALAAIDHPNVVRFLHADRTVASPAQWYVLSEYVEGRTLAEIIDAGERLPVSVCLAIVGGLLDALVSFHPDQPAIDALVVKDPLSEAEWVELQRLQDRGLVHRDIKPQNLLLTAGNEVKLIDFNISSRVGAPVQTVSHTPGYQPPDPDLTRWDVSVDLFAVGVVLFELLTGEHPYPDRDPHGEGPVDACAVVEGLPAEVGAYLAKACAPVRAERFGTAAEMLDALRSLNQVVSPTPAAGPARGRQSERRPPVTRARYPEGVTAPTVEAAGGAPSRPPGTSMSPECDEVRVVRADGNNNVRLAVPLEAFDAVGVNPSHHPALVEGSTVSGHVEVTVSAAGSRFVADVAGLAPKPREWPPEIGGIARFVAAAVPYAHQRIVAERANGQNRRAAIYSGDLARAHGSSVEETRRLYGASSAPSTADRDLPLDGYTPTEHVR